MIRNPLRRKLHDHQMTYGMWVTIESPNVTELAVILGLDWVVVDMEHGHLDLGDVIEHVRAVRGSDTSVLVRVPEAQQGIVKRVLDIGSQGVILPLVRNAADVERGFSFGRYPPRGERGVGGERAVKWGLGSDEYLGYANDETLIIPIIETRDAADHIEEILAVDGLEAVLFGPADLSASHGFLGQWEGPGLAQQILDMRAKAAARGIASAIMARSIADSILRRDQGFNMVALGADMGLMIRALGENLVQLGRPAVPRLIF